MRLKAMFPNPDRALWPNQFVKARLRLTVRKGAVVIPAVAVQRGPQGAFVYVASGDARPSVRAGHRRADRGRGRADRQGASSAGDKVVSEGQSQLRPGAKLAVRDRRRAGRRLRGGGTPP